MVSVEKGGILVTSFLWLWILSHGNVLLAFFCVHFTWIIFICVLKPYQICTWDEHAASTWPAALLCFACIMQARKVRPCHSTRRAKEAPRAAVGRCCSIDCRRLLSKPLCFWSLYKMLCLVYHIIIHNNTSILHSFCSWHCQKCIGMISFIIH